jgi:transposase InsO family protein
MSIRGPQCRTPSIGCIPGLAPGSNTMDVAFCVAAVEQALMRFGLPEIFNTDQGSQFTSPRFTGILTDAAMSISMDGRAAGWTMYSSSGCGAA